MGKPRKNQNKTLEAFVNGYNTASLIGALEQFENSLAWQVYKAYAAKVQRQYEVDSMDLIGTDGKSHSAAYASGYAKCAEDMTNDFMAGLKATLRNVSPVIENPRPEEDVEV